MDVYKASEFARLNIEIEWAVDRLVPAYGVNFIYADPKVGKSILCVQLAHALGTNTPLLNRRTFKQWRVLYVQADEPAPEWAHQLRGLGEEVQQGWDTVHLGPSAFQVTTEYEGVKKLGANYDFLILDSLLSLFGDLTTTSSVLIALDRLARLYQGPMLIIHHKRKGMPGVPDKSINSMAFSFALAARGSTLYDLKDSSLSARGRLVKADIQLLRTPSGLWIVDPAGGQWG